MSDLRSWWREMPGPVKFRLYTRLTLQIGVALAVAGAALTSRSPWPAAGAVVAGAATLLAAQVRPELAAVSAPTARRWAIPLATAVIVGVWVVFAIVVNVTSNESTADDARTTGGFVLVLGSMLLLTFTRHRWWLLAAASVATGLAYGAADGERLRTTLVSFAIGAVVIGLTLVTIWGLHIVDDLDRTKDVETQLQVAEERLRFGRDLHDVVGRSFSAIAVKSELAATLARAGAAERASAEMNEVKALAVESMEEMRTLVRGYRDIDLDGEVAGARSLLSATGCRLVVEGDPARVPSRLHEVAAWVVREGTTNIVRHSSASTATLSLGVAGMALRNDGATAGPSESSELSGLRGLSERLAAHGATLTTTSRGGEFVLEITWETA